MALMGNSVLAQLKLSLQNAQLRELEAQKERSNIEAEKQKMIEQFDEKLVEQDKLIETIHREVTDTQAVVDLLEAQLQTVNVPDFTE
jgi:uncharacterized coiled-coil protein SlyX